MSGGYPKRPGIGRTASGRRRKGGHPANVAVAVILLVVCGLWLSVTKELPWSDPHQVKFAFKTAIDLRSGSPIRIAGVNVGKVSSIERGPGQTAIVTAEVQDRALPIHEDATAKLRPRIFLEGNFFIDLRPGSPGAPALEEGETIPVTRTAVPVQFDEVLSILQRDQRDRLRGALRELAVTSEGGGPEAFNDTIPYFKPAFKGTAENFEALRGTAPHDLSGSIRATARVSRALARSRPQLGSLVRSFATVTGTLAERQLELRTSLRRLDAVVREAEPSLAALTDALPETRALIREFRPALRESPPAIREAIPLTVQADRLLRRRELPALVDELHPTVRSLARFAPRATRLFGKLEDPGRCTLDTVLPTLRAQVPDPPHTSGEPIYRELLYSFVGLSSASQNFDGNGFGTRYHFGEGDEVISTGNVPSVGGALFGTQAEPLLGSRPSVPNDPPPFEPRVPCTRSGPPDLRSEAGPSGFTSTGRRGKPSPLVRRGGSPKQVLRRILDAKRRGQRRLSKLDPSETGGRR